MSYRLVSGKPSITTPVRYGFAMFAIGMVVGVVATSYTVAGLVAEMPGEDQFDAMRRDVRALEYTLIGWGLTVLTSSGLGVAVGLRKYTPTPAEDEHESARTD